MCSERIFVRIPRTGTTSIASIEKEVGFISIGGKDMGFWGVSRFGVNKAYSSKLTICINNFINKDAYKFTFIRNPYSRAVSIWRHNSFSKRISFKEFCLMVDDGSLSSVQKWHTEPYYYHLFNNDNCLVNFIGRYESLQSDFDRACESMSVDSVILPHKNKSSHKHYTEYYDEETIGIIAKKYSKDIEYFGYKFGE